MSFVENMAVYFDPETVGVSVASINGVTVNGALEHDLEESLESPTRRGVPMFVCDKNVLPSIDKGDTLTIGATAYIVRDVQVDDFDPVAIIHLNNP